MSEAETAYPSIASRLVGIVGLLLAHALALCFVLFALLKVVPPYTKMFDENDVPLPTVMHQVIAWSEFCVAFWFLLFPLIMLVDAAVVCILALVAYRRRRLLSAYSHLCLLAACTLLAYISALLCVSTVNMVR